MALIATCRYPYWLSRHGKGLASFRTILTPAGVQEPTRTNQEVIAELTKALTGGIRKINRQFDDGL